MEIGWRDIQRGHLGVRDLDAFAVGVLIEPALHGQPFVRRGTGNEKKPCPDFIYRNRNLIERCWSRLKEWRAIATRYDKTATS